MEWNGPAFTLDQVVGATGPGRARARVTWRAFRVIAVGAGQRVGLALRPATLWICLASLPPRVAGTKMAEM